MNFTELGLFVGMTYRGRQLFDTIVKETTDKREKLLSASTAREGDTGNTLLRIQVGEAGYGAYWREYTSGQWAMQLLCFLGALWFVALAAGTGYLIVSDILGTSNNRLGHAAYFISVALSLFILMSGYFMIVLAYELVTSMKLGFFPDSGKELFKRLSAHSWLVGDSALYISEQDAKTRSTKVRTVFFDAVGSVYADDEKGSEAIVLSARDGSEIARLPHPVCDANVNGNAIAAQIVAILRTSNPEVAVK
jgi:hypothetical protein